MFSKFNRFSILINNILVVICTISLDITAKTKILKIQKFMESQENKLTINSECFKEGENLSDKYTPQGDDFNPSLRWSGIPEGTKSFALAVEDPDAPMGTWYHWLVTNIPLETTSINENTIPGTEITNSWGIKGYKGPSPPGKSLHRYFFKIFALKTDKIHDNSIDSFYKEIKKNLISEASIMGKYKKKH